MVTGNVGKWKIANDIFKEFNVELLREKIDTPEIQAHNVEDISLYSGEYAANLLQKPVIKSDVGYYIESLGGFPGPFLRYINKMLTSEDILKMLMEKKNRKIILRECLTFACPGYKSKQFINEEEALISLEAKGEGTTFDRIIVFKGQKYPKSMNTEVENYKHFKKTLHIYYEMAEYLENLK